MNRTPLALAAAAGILAAGVSSSVPAAVPASVPGAVPATGQVMTIMGPTVTDAALPAASVRCRAGATPLAVLTARGRAGQRASYATLVNSKVTHTGITKADRYGTFVASTAIADHRRTGVVLVLNRRPVVRAVLAPNCTRPAVPAPSAPGSGAGRGSATSYTLNHNGNGSVTRWDPCSGDIHVRINAAGGGAGALADTQAALAALSKATGLRFVYDGPTTFVPTSTNTASQPADIVVAWAPPGTGAGRSDYYQSGAVGEGGWRSSGSSSDGGATWNWKIVHGFVVVDPAAGVTAGFGNGVTRGALLLHELGHVAGLGHTNDGAQVMYPALRPATVGSFGAGDLAGLKAVGATNGCTKAS